MRRLRVCHVITLLELGGAQRNTLYTLRELDRRRFEAALISGPGGLLDEEAAAIPDLLFETCPSLRRSVRPAVDARALLDLYRRLRRLRPDLVHTHSSKAGILGRLAAALAGVPIIIHTVHGWGFTPLQSAAKRHLFVYLERIGAQLTTKLIAVSEANAVAGAQAGIAPREAFEIIRSGIEIERFRGASPDGGLRREIGIPEQAPLAGMIACLKPQKAPLDYVEAARRVLADLPGAHFLLAGDGALRGEVESAIRQAGLGGRFHLLGWRSDPERIVAEIDVLVLTSRHEGLPRVVPEAMAAAKPVVVTAVDGSPEAVRHGESGLLVPPGDLEAMAEALCRLLSDPETARRMGLRGRERVGEWDIDEMVRRQERLYLRLGLQSGLLP